MLTSGSSTVASGPLSAKLSPLAQTSSYVTACEPSRACWQAGDLWAAETDKYISQKAKHFQREKKTNIVTAARLAMQALKADKRPKHGLLICGMRQYGSPDRFQAQFLRTGTARYANNGERHAV